MKGDLSQGAFDPRRFSRVVAQQGRVQLDADWNEQAAIVDYRMRTMIGDVFGHGGLVSRVVAPRANAGFGVHVHHGRHCTAADVEAPPAFTAAAFAGSQAYSIEAWVHSDDVISPGMRTIVAGYSKDDGSDASMVLRVALDTLGCVVFETVDAKGARASITSARPVRAGGYCSIVCLFTGDANEIWIDDVLDRRGAARGLADGELTLTVGASRVAPASFGARFAGTIERIGVRRGRRFDMELFGAKEAVHEKRVAEWIAPVNDDATIARELCVAPGRCYVNGILCDQPFHATLSLEITPGGQPPAGMFLAYLDVWERYISAYEEPALRDAALGGIDTTGRVRTVAAAHLMPVDSEPDIILEALAAANHDRGEIAVDVADTILQDNLLYRFEVHAPGPAASTADAPGAVRAELQRPDDSATAGSRRNLRVAAALSSTWEIGQFLQLIDASAPTANTIFSVLGRDDSPADGTLVFLVDGVPTGLDDAIGVRPIASLLWSRNNGHAVFALDDAPLVGKESTTINLRDEAGRSGLLQIGDVVVVTPEDRVEASRPGIVTTITDIAVNLAGTVSVVVPARLDGIDASATLRRWDGFLPAVVSADGKPAPTRDLNVRFSDAGVFATGDYWFARIRPDAAQPLEWRQEARGAPAFLPPFGIPHTFAPLAVVDFDARGPNVRMDLRRVVRAAADLDEELHAELDVLRELEEVVVEQATAPPPVSRDVEFIERVVEIARHPGLVFSRHPLPGCEPAGSVVEARVDEPRWKTARHAPEKGAAQAAAIDGIIFVLYASGSLWRRDPSHAENLWEACRPFGGERSDYAIVVAAGRLFVLGGVDVRGRPSAAVDAYDPREDTWSSAFMPMRKARSRAMASGDAHRIIVFGGLCRTFFGWRYASRSIEEYDIVSDVWRRLDPMPLRRYAGVAVARGGSTIVIGGLLREGVLDGRAAATARIDRFYRRTGEWVPHEPLAETRVDPRAAVIGEEIIVLGDGTTAERVRPALDEVSTFPADDRSAFGFAAVNGIAYAIAGTTYNGTHRHDVQSCIILDRLHAYRYTGEKGDA